MEDPENFRPTALAGKTEDPEGVIVKAKVPARKVSQRGQQGAGDAPTEPARLSDEPVESLDVSFAISDKQDAAEVNVDVSVPAEPPLEQESIKQKSASLRRKKRWSQADKSRLERLRSDSVDSREDTEPLQTPALASGTPTGIHRASRELEKAMKLLQPQLALTRRLEAELEALQRENASLRKGSLAAAADERAKPHAGPQAGKPLAEHAGVAPRDVSTPAEHAGVAPNWRSTLAGWYVDGQHAAAHAAQEAMEGDANTSNANSRKSVFPDSKDVQHKLNAFEAPDQFQYYRKEGVVAAVARSKAFEVTSLAIVAFSALWMAIEIDNNEEKHLSKADVGWQFGECCLCIWFIGEWFIRFFAFERIRDVPKDSWMMFDAAVNAATLLDLSLALASSAGDSDEGETKMLTFIRILRLCRILRLAKLLKMMPELLVLITGMTCAVRAVASTLLLLGVEIFIFAMFMRAMSQDTNLEREYFSTIPRTMFVLTTLGTMPDVYDFLDNDIGENHFFVGLMFFFFFVMTSYVLLNMLIGVLVKVIAVVAAADAERVEVSGLRKKLAALMRDAGLSADRDMNKEDFVGMLGSRAAKETLLESGIDVMSLIEFADFLFVDGDVDVDEAVEFVMRLRTGSPATVRDLMELHCCIRDSWDPNRRAPGTGVKRGGAAPANTRAAETIEDWMRLAAV